jgi:hypothetical protein
MAKLVLTIKLKMDVILLKTNFPIFHYLPRETFFYFTGALFEASDQASKNILYFHYVLEIPH